MANRDGVTPDERFGRGQSSYNEHPNVPDVKEIRLIDGKFIIVALLIIFVLGAIFYLHSLGILPLRTV